MYIYLYMNNIQSSLYDKINLKVKWLPNHFEYICTYVLLLLFSFRFPKIYIYLLEQNPFVVTIETIYTLRVPFIFNSIQK